MKKVRIGVFGAGRFPQLYESFTLAGADVVALCDFNETRAKTAIKDAGCGSSVAVYSEFDLMLDSGVDAVVLANFFHEHAPYAIRCMERGVHIFSECLANSTMAEGVRLARAAESSSSIYMLAENYPFMVFNREIKRVCDGGTLGKLLYAESEYNHVNGMKEFSYFPEHWRNYLPRTYYITHSLGPVMYATGATPTRVSAFACYSPDDTPRPTAKMVGDVAAIITTLNDDGSVFRLTGCSAFGGMHLSTRVCGAKGQIEKLRGIPEKVLLRYNSWDVPEGMEAENFYKCTWDDEDEELIVKTAHGGSDFVIAREFLRCIEQGREPDFPFDLHSAINMSSVAILGHRSVLNGGMPYDIPDFRREEDRLAYENDEASPFYYTDGRAPTVPCCSNPSYAPTEEQMRLYRELVIGKNGDT